MFPKFLPPPSIFPTKKRNAGRPVSPSLTSEPPVEKPSGKTTIEDHVSCIRCSTCATQICLTTQIVSKGFTGRHGRAYLVSTESTESPYQEESLPNTLLQTPVSRQLVTGNHTVSDMDCVFCGSVLGWKYVSAEQESQRYGQPALANTELTASCRYKVGKFILETKRVMTASAWDPAFGAGLVESVHATKEAEKTLFGDVEFDSQDEDECEDLFSGIWSPGLAERRRNRRVVRKPSAPLNASQR